MATTRSRRLRRSTEKKGKRVARPKKVTYRGLVHGSLANLSRRDKYGPRPIPQEAYKEEMITLAATVGKPLSPGWLRRYCDKHIQAGITDGYLREHEGRALSVSPKARFRYRNARRAVREALRDGTAGEETADLCRNLDKEVGPTSLKTKAELVKENRVLAAKLNDELTPPRQPLQVWNSLSTVTNGDTMNEDQDASDFERPVAGPSKSPVTRLGRNPYPSPESLPRESRARTDHEALPEPPTPCPEPSTSQLSPLTPISPPGDFVAEGRVEFVHEKFDVTEDDEDVLMLDMPGPCNLTLKFSAASIERRIVELESDVKERDAIAAQQAQEIARLTAEQGDYARQREEIENKLESNTTEYAHAMASLNALIAARDDRITALETECLSERAEKDRARTDLAGLRQEHDAQRAALTHIEAELAASRAEQRALEAQIAACSAAIEAAEGAHQGALTDLKEEYEVQLQLVRAQLGDYAESRRRWEALSAALTADIARGPSQRV